MNLNKTLILFILLIISQGTLALSTDRNQPITIEANKATIDDASGTAIYEGNVVIMQGSIRMTANKVTLNYTAKQTLDKVVAEGEPVHFKQSPDGDKADINAKANRMEYFASKNTIHLTQGAELWQGQDSFAGEHITYNTHDGIITANKGKNETGRVKVTIQPLSKQQ